MGKNPRNGFITKTDSGRMKNLNRHTTSKEIELIIKNLNTK